jgi:hypothetical protein
MKTKKRKLNIIDKKKRNKIYLKNKNTRKINNNKFVKLNCSPENNNINDYTCYTNNDLYNLKELWNLRHSDKQIKTKNPKQIWNILKNYYKNTCNKESCWINQIAKGTKLEKELIDSFAPKSPATWKKNPREWLSSLDIVSVMNQYEKKYKCFEFMGPTPIDFDTIELNGKCVWDEICNLNIQELINKKKTKIGIIFNTDPHYKGGQHWISLFINLKKGNIFFFDSVGNQIPREIMNLVNRIQSQGLNLTNSIHFIFDQNYPNEHQYNSYSCGLYSLFFIVHMLEDKLTTHYLKTHKLKDKYIEKFRKIYFNEEL